MNSYWIFGQYLANVKIKIINWITIFILGIFIDVNNDRRIRIQNLLLEGAHQMSMFSYQPFGMNQHRER